MAPNQAVSSDKSIRFFPLAASQPLTILSVPEVLNASVSRRAAGWQSAARPALSLRSLISGNSPEQLGMVSPEPRVPGTPLGRFLLEKTHKSGYGLGLQGFAPLT